MDMWSDDQMRSIHKMLNPRSIAVVGASPKGGYGGRLLNAVLKAKDRVRIYPVNPNYDEIAEYQLMNSRAAQETNRHRIVAASPQQNAGAID